MPKNILFDDRLTKPTKLHELLPLPFICLAIGLVSFAFSRSLMISGVVAIIPIPFFILFLIKYKPNEEDFKPRIQLLDEGILSTKSGRLFKWKDFDRIIISKRAIYSRFGGFYPSSINMVKGDLVTTIEMNLPNNKIKELKNILEKKGIKVEIN